MPIRELINRSDVSFTDFYNTVGEIGNWDNVNSTEIIYDYINEKMREGVYVSHILKAIEENDFQNETDVWKIWLGNSMETPELIKTKQDLSDALSLDENEIIDL